MILVNQPEKLDSFMVGSLLKNFKEGEIYNIFSELKKLHQEKFININKISFQIVSTQHHTVKDFLIKDLQNEKLINICKKIKQNNELNLEDSLEIAEKVPNIASGYLIINISIGDKVSINKLLHDYLENFKEGNLSIDSSKEFQQYSKQKSLFYEVFERKRNNYGDKQTIKLSDVWAREHSRENGNFWELVFSLSDDKDIEIENFGYDGYYKILVMHDDLSGNIKKYWYSKTEPYVLFSMLKKFITEYQKEKIKEYATDFSYNSNEGKLFFNDQIIITTHKTNKNKEAGRRKILQRLWENKKIVLDKVVVYKGLSQKRYALSSLAGYIKSEHVDDTIKFFRRRLKRKSMPAEIVGEDGYLLVLYQ